MDLRSEGHSLRAIAGAVGVSRTQVHKDLHKATDPTVNQLTVEPPSRIVGLSGKSYPATRLLKQDCSTLTAHAVEAYYGRVWEFEGYDTWDAYCTGEGIHVPREFIPELRAAGLSSRAIAPVAGVSHTTVRRDLAVVTNVPTESKSLTSSEPTASTDSPSRIVGLDGRSRQARGES